MRKHPPRAVEYKKSLTGVELIDVELQKVRAAVLVGLEIDLVSCWSLIRSSVLESVTTLSDGTIPTSALIPSVCNQPLTL